jgi:Protein of unknown function (DUF3830)
MSTLHLSIGGRLFVSRLRWDLAPQSCTRLMQMLPLCGQVIHARWSGEAIWLPLGTNWPIGSILEPESATGHPAPGEVLLFADRRSEPELLIPYGPTRFASRAGPLEGNPVLLIEDDLPQLVELGREILLHGAMELRIDRKPTAS